MSVPLYQQICNDLVKEIKTNNLKVGEQLPTEKELALTYKVSRITAKRALSELEQMGMATRIQGKGSFVTKVKKVQFSGTNRRLLFVMPFEGMNFGNFTPGLLPTINAAEITLFMTYSNYLRENSATSIRENFDGLIYYPMHTEDFLDVLLELSMYNFPIVLLDKKIIDLPFPCVFADNFNGGILATHLLIQQGHQRIAYVMSNEPHHPHTTRNRYLGYIKELKENHLSYHTTLDDPLATVEGILKLIESQALTGWFVKMTWWHFKSWVYYNNKAILFQWIYQLLVLIIFRLPN